MTLAADVTVYNRENVPDAWEAHTHPEGILYFRHKKRVRLRARVAYLLLTARLQRIYTEAWLCDSEELEEIEDFLVRLDEEVQDLGYELPPDAELVLELENIPPGAEHKDLVTEKPAKHYWTYYYVNHAARVLFWIQEHEISNELEQLRGFHSASHISAYYECTLLHSLDHESRTLSEHGIEEFYW